MPSPIVPTKTRPAAPQLLPQAVTEQRIKLPGQFPITQVEAALPGKAFVNIKQLVPAAYIDATDKTLLVLPAAGAVTPTSLQVRIGASMYFLVGEVLTLLNPFLRPPGGTTPPSTGGGTTTPPPAVTLTGVSIDATAQNEGTTVARTAIATFSNSSTLNVSTLGTWSVPAPYSFSGNLLAVPANSITGDSTTVELTLTYLNVVYKQIISIVDKTVVVTPPPTDNTPYLTNQQVKLRENTLWQKNNVSTANLFPSFTLTDGNAQTEFHPSNAFMLTTPNVMVFDVARYYKDPILRGIRVADGAGSFADYPTRFAIKRRDTGATDQVASWTGEQYGTEYDLPAIPAASQVVFDQLYLTAKDINQYPNDLTLILDHRGEINQSVSLAPTAFKWSCGINGYYWYGLLDETSPNKSALVPAKIALLTSTFTSYRCFAATEFTFPADGQVAFEPVARGWTQDTLLQALKQGGMRVWTINCNMPKWMQEGYPHTFDQYNNLIGTWGGSGTDLAMQHPNDWALVRYADLDKKTTATAYRDFKYLTQQRVTRYGRNAQASTANTVLYQLPETYQPRNVVKVGLGYCVDDESGNELDKDWFLRICNMSGPELYAFQKEQYLAAKAADPSINVVLPGFGRPVMDLAKEMYYCAVADGFTNTQGVPFPADTLNSHLYPRSTGAAQYGGARGYAIAADANPLYEYILNKMVEVCSLYLGGMPLWITECGVDLNPNSPLAAISVPGKTAKQVQGDIISRNALYFKEKGVDVVTWYQGYDEDENSAGQFASCGLLEGIPGEIDPVTTWPKTMTYQRRPAANYLVQLQAVMGEHTIAQTITTAPQRLSRWSKTGGKDVYAAYLPSHTGATLNYNFAALPAGASVRVHVLNPNSAVTTATAFTVPSNGLLPLVLTETPLLIEVL